MASRILGRRWWTIALLLIGLGVAPPDGCKPGRVRFVRLHDPSLDAYTADPSTAMQTWFVTHYERMVGYTPSFDSRTSWYPNAWAYKDLYAIYTSSTIATQQPSWILRDADGNPLYIPWGCSGGSCPQYAADPGNPAFRDNWIGEATRDIVSKGYRGIFVDDVNMAIKVGDGMGQDVLPIDPRTGQPMTIADWRRYVAEFVEAIRAAFPTLEIVHNAVWWFAPQTDPYVQRQVAACDAYWMERGVADGVDSTSFRGMLDFVDFVHANTRAVVWQNLSTSTSDREYAMAAYFLTSLGFDGFCHGATSSPSDWWTGWDVDLGNPTSIRLSSGSVWRRDFEHGTVLLNEPGQPTVTVAADGYRLDGAHVGSVRLRGGSGVVLLRP
jgi:putative glycosyl hydrolase-like family 15 (GHL15) protein